MLAGRDSLEVFPLAADSSSLLQTRVRAFDLEKQNCIGASSWLSSTALWASEYQCDGMASVSTVQRYYASAYGRFNTPDRLTRSAMASDPGSWNRYAYVGGDPVNRRDPRGTCWVSDNGNQVEDATVTDQDAMAGYGYHHVDASCGGSFSTTVTDSAPDPEPDPCNGTDGGCAPTTIESPVSDPAEPQGGGGGGNLYVSNFSNTGQSQATITSALGKINVLLPGDSDCSQWLGGLNVVGSLVGGLIDGNAYGSATLPSNVNTIAAFEGSKNPDGSSVGVPVTAAFTVNSNGAFFNSGFTVGPKQYQGGTVQAQLFVVLHELAHMLQTNGLGAPGFQNDFGNAAAGRSNDGLIDNHCGDLINHWY